MNATLERKRMNSTKEEPFEQRNGKKAYSKDEILLLFGFECDTILYLDLLVLLMNPVLLYDVEEIYKNENTKKRDIFGILPCVSIIPCGDFMNP